ncbi:MAG: cyclodeaminase/cyclohydrolase family protein [Pseudomonadales bacterium]|nr:cyclodeaminase/cyclohydrolase family protein [Pseudomonadales bacterium]MBO6597695.1 cyclodeaminase/cyclohydrolase family protein [Pseudomonadales bacterium]MBO6657885.1 cyclodeaminase/cyclohydrolase family protein [Pseudomonadales bacterium]MBO6704010.1 cyclodeaminase/cyclohydrolase family protein [Pseudomonadales bacterium]MBO6823933.1 cyclodeaminase/cyclohydrolase family protein [Pseudomonadales bacterium]
MTELINQKLGAYLDQVSAKKSTPGGGAVAAVMAAEACALMNMVANFTKGDEFSDVVTETTQTMERLMGEAEADQEAFKSVMKAYRSEGEMTPALIGAAEVPARIIDLCVSRLDHLELLATKGNSNLISDIAIAALLFDAAIKSSELNVMINIRELDEPPAKIASALKGLPAATTRLQYIVSTIRTGLQ